MSTKHADLPRDQEAIVSSSNRMSRDKPRIIRVWLVFATRASLPSPAFGRRPSGRA